MYRVVTVGNNETTPLRLNSLLGEFTKILRACIISATMKTPPCVQAKVCAKNGGATARSLDNRSYARLCATNGDATARSLDNRGYDVAVLGVIYWGASCMLIFVKKNITEADEFCFIGEIININSIF